MVRSGKNAYTSLPVILLIMTLVTLLGAPTVAHAVVSVTLSWTAPGDDSLSGNATLYDMRQSSEPITETNFANATRVNGLPTPGAPRTRQSVSVPNLLEGSVYYFALKTADERGNWSRISNVVVFTSTVPVTPPPSVPLAFSAPQPNPARDLTRLVFDLPRPADVWIEVLDVLGRRVRMLAHEMRPSGRNEVQWRLDDDSARPLPAGLYLVRARTLGEVFLRRLTIVR